MTFTDERPTKRHVFAMPSRIIAAAVLIAVSYTHLTLPTKA